MTPEELFAEYQAGRLTWEQYQSALAAAVAAAAAAAELAIATAENDQAPASR